MTRWIRKHPQMTASLLLGVFTQIQGSLALANFPMHPLTSWGINTVFSVVMFVLAFAVKNLKDEGTQQETTDENV